jgi:hypothetical protein
MRWHCCSVTADYASLIRTYGLPCAPSTIGLPSKMKNPKALKYWETSHVRTAGNGLAHCGQCSELVALTASACPSCGSKEYSGFYRRQHAREETNDNVVIITTVSLTLLGVVHGVSTSSSTFWMVLTAAWQGTLGLLLGVPVGFAINFMRFFGRRGGL